MSAKADIQPVIAACVAPALVRDAHAFVKTDGEHGLLPFVPGNDYDRFWGDHASIVSVEPQGARTRVTVQLKGTSKGYEHFHEKDSLLLEKRGNAWMIVGNRSAQ